VWNTRVGGGDGGARGRAGGAGAPQTGGRGGRAGGAAGRGGGRGGAGGEGGGSGGGGGGVGGQTRTRSISGFRSATIPSRSRWKARRSRKRLGSSKRLAGRSMDRGPR
jgi:hypothetical protein